MQKNGRWIAPSVFVIARLADLFICFLREGVARQMARVFEVADAGTAETGLLVPLSAIHVLEPDIYVGDQQPPPPETVSDPTGGWI